MLIQIYAFCFLIFSKYPFKKNTKIITFFNNFDDSLSEESLWQISENIKPRNTKKKSQQQ